MAKGDTIEITHETTVEAILEALPRSEVVLRKYFGPGIAMPGQTWTAEPLKRACLLRGVSERKLLAALRRIAGGKRKGRA